MSCLGQDMYDDFINDIENNSFTRFSYADTWDYEDEYSHDDIKKARKEFIDKVNKYFKENDMPYIMREVVENAWVYNLDDDIIRNSPVKKINVIESKKM